MKAAPAAAMPAALAAVTADGPILLFDGVCNLCNGTVRFVARRDAGRRYRFCPLQSALGRALVDAHGGTAELDTIYLVEDGRLYDRSTAALRVLRGLRMPWPLLSAFLVVPRPVRDAVYNFIGRRRYRWFGRQDRCPLPDAGLAARFLGMDDPDL